MPKLYFHVQFSMWKNKYFFSFKNINLGDHLFSNFHNLQTSINYYPGFWLICSNNTFSFMFYRYISRFELTCKTFFDFYLAHVIEQPNFRIPNLQYLQTKIVYIIFWLIKSRTNSQQRHLKPSLNVPQKNVFHKKINKKVNKQNIRNLENWLFDDVSEIKEKW